MPTGSNTDPVGPAPTRYGHLPSGSLGLYPCDRLFDQARSCDPPVPLMIIVMPLMALPFISMGIDDDSHHGHDRCRGFGHRMRSALHAIAVELRGGQSSRDPSYFSYATAVLSSSLTTASRRPHLRQTDRCSVFRTARSSRRLNSTGRTNRRPRPSLTTLRKPTPASSNSNAARPVRYRLVLTPAAEKPAKPEKP